MRVKTPGDSNLLRDTPGMAVETNVKTTKAGKESRKENLEYSTGLEPRSFRLWVRGLNHSAIWPANVNRSKICYLKPYCMLLATILSHADLSKCMIVLHIPGEMERPFQHYTDCCHTGVPPGARVCNKIQKKHLTQKHLLVLTSCTHTQKIASTVGPIGTCRVASLHRYHSIGTCSVASHVHRHPSIGTCSVASLHRYMQCCIPP